MKLYLECNMGAAGDMLMAALLELLPDRQKFLDRMNGLGIPGVRVECVPAVKCGIAGSHIKVSVNGEEETVQDVPINVGTEGSTEEEHEHHGHEHEHERGEGHTHVHHHFSYEDVRGLIGALDLPDQVKSDALAVYARIGEAESKVHGVPMDQIHFHEVGSMDAVADVVGCCLLIHMLGVRDISASPVHVGSGFVRCAHGILPVPAPATACILEGVPIYGGRIRGELCTPTGAALLRHFVGRFGEMQPMRVDRIGCGMGSKDFEAANCIRAFLGEADGRQDEIAEISCNLDDMTPEAIGYTSELLMKSGALDVFVTPIQMKKNRPASMLTCLCRPEDREKISKLMLLHTTTLGVRYTTCQRSILSTSIGAVETPYGRIRVKYADGNGIRKSKPEYEDVRASAEKFGVPFGEVYRQAAAAQGKEDAE
ncbi:nickel pincer cofactor biosynthesis protein LarC [Caproicibacter sp. BJN0012]|uniref:nickel pincer cofactor biosynthesis protein LarC n=1 Tax=Caproicibacter sp. BJN0012 TaxID=3110227 RepID=UPI002E132A6F